ncbi:MAG: formate dehydrogenase accessory sulfurtransferase FdhD [Lachnospiraceae bacterium]|nr:formate dehydrogenase accessory sulfurtransferase FdhD [Lachnospiraceae bacterium]
MKITNLYETPKCSEASAAVRFFSDGRRMCVTKDLIAEHTIAVYIDDAPVLEIACTASSLPELVVGRLFTEGKIAGADEIETVTIGENGERADVVLRMAACEASQKATRNKVAELDRNVLFAILEKAGEELPLHRLTYAAHGAFLIDMTGVSYAAEDIGRHNAIDKVIGHLLIEGLDPKKCLIYTTGRVPLDSVNKAIRAGVAAIVSKADPTAQTVRAAHDAGLRLICRARSDSFDLYE